MCGITGIFHRDGQPASTAILRRMTDAIAHRGPDGEGHFVEGSIALGHRRLAIIDPSPAGRQPMCSQDGRYILSYNGEVYNYVELRVQLQSLGHHFRSDSDTEVVLAALAEWGQEALKRFNGMFAFALWDKRERTLLLARDRYGIKPCYYSFAGETLLFGSEVKALLQHPAYTKGINKRVLFEYFTFQNVFSDNTLFDNVKLLPAGCLLRIPLEGAPQLTRWWDFHFREPQQARDEQEEIEEFKYLFNQAVNRQLVSDVEVATYLSGGMDSGSVTALAARNLNDLKTFTVGFDLSSAQGVEIGFDERREAEFMSNLFKTEQYEVVLKAGDMERALPKLIHHLEDPRVGQCYPNYYLCRLTSKFVKVVLSGTGGDEMFAGYPWRYYRAVVNASFDAYTDKYFQFWQRLIPGEVIGDCFAPINAEIADVDTHALFRNVFATRDPMLTRPEDYINHSLYFEAKTFLHGLLLVEDKLSMAHGLESRVPFLDNDLVDFAMRVPARFKLGNLGEVVRINENEPGSKKTTYYQITRDGKMIMRKAMADLIPSEITSGVKKGFTGPDASWFKGESLDYVRSMLHDPKAHIYNYLDPKPIHALMADHFEGRENRRLLIWSLLSVEHWCRQFLS